MTTLYVSAAEREPQKIVAALRQVIEGRSNATGAFTLTASATATTVTHASCAPGSVVTFGMPQTANAAGALATTYILAADVIKGQFIVTHASATMTDRTFGYRIC